MRRQPVPCYYTEQRCILLFIFEFHYSTVFASFSSFYFFRQFNNFRKISVKFWSLDKQHFDHLSDQQHSLPTKLLQQLIFCPRAAHCLWTLFLLHRCLIHLLSLFDSQHKEKSNFFFTDRGLRRELFKMSTMTGTIYCTSPCIMLCTCSSL